MSSRGQKWELSYHVLKYEFHGIPEKNMPFDNTRSTTIVTLNHKMNNGSLFFSLFRILYLKTLND